MTATRLNQSTIMQCLNRVGSDKAGITIMRKKAQMLYFEIKDLDFVPSAILKQEALSLGAEYATPREQILYKGQKQGVLMASQSQLEKLCTKLKRQEFGLKNLANMLEKHLDSLSSTSDFAKTLKDPKARIMPIVNITPDSFYEGSRNDSKQAIERIYALLQKGFSLIDIGAASSRPGSELIESSVEIARLKDVCNEIKSQKLHTKALFSIDTYNPQTAQYALESGFKIINDISGFSHPLMAQVNANYGAYALLMHSKGTPKDMQNVTNTTYGDFFGEIDTFFARKIEEIVNAGGKEIILDIGFGFAKKMEQNLALVNHLAHFKHFGYPLLLGASRKSTLGEITGKQANERLSATLALHLLGAQNGADILRTHDEDAHLDSLLVLEAMNTNSLGQGVI